ncbi:MAG TPA: LUD domain-containing protein [Rhizomicrobium sp.]|nr:LUD domain-containing protein [Rhizomicrobium sp.]
MSARDAILSAIRAQRVNAAARPAAYRVPSLGEDGVTFFIAQATRAAAEVRRLGNMREVPGAIAEALRNRNMKAVVHFPEACGPLRDLPWDVAPGLLKAHSAPGPDDAALSLAPYAIAETGTLAFTSRPDAPASWHFRSGLEIAIVRARDIVPDFETVIARAKADGWPSTLNLVTGPSRTGDIEQTLELGAHGPKALAVLVVDG